MAADKRYIDEDFQGNRALSLAGVTDSAGNPIAVASPVVALTATGTGGTVTLALGSASGSFFCAITSSANLTVNLTDSGTTIKLIRLEITMGGAFTTTIQYNGVTTTIRYSGFSGSTAPTFPSAVTSPVTVYVLEGKADGSLLRWDNYYTSSV